MIYYDVRFSSKAFFKFATFGQIICILATETGRELERGKVNLFAVNENMCVGAYNIDG